MKKEDIQYIFKDQIQNDSVYFIIEENEIKQVIKHPTTNIDDLEVFLDNFIPNGSEVLPRFRKEI